MRIKGMDTLYFLFSILFLLSIKCESLTILPAFMLTNSLRPNSEIVKPTAYYKAFYISRPDPAAADEYRFLQFRYPSEQECAGHSGS